MLTKIYYSVMNKMKIIENLITFSNKKSKPVRGLL